MSKKVISLSSHEGNVMYIIGYVRDNFVQGGASEKRKFVNQMYKIGSYKKILDEILKRYGDKIEFVK